MVRVKPMIRVFGLSAAMLGMGLFMTLHNARAHLRESLAGFGRQVASLAAFKAQSEPRDLYVNGLQFRILSIGTSLGVTEALDRFRSLCHSAGQVDLPNEVREKLNASPSEQAIDDAGVVRQQVEGEGYLGCLDVGLRVDGEGLLTRLMDFAKTRNLRSLGQLRYALARRSGDRTTLFVLWTDGDAKLNEMFPKTGDVPGRDLADLPRPNGGRRLLSAFEGGQPYGLATYSLTGDSLRAVQDAFEQQLQLAGWATHRTKQGTLLLEKVARHALVLFRRTDGGQVVVTISDLG